MNNLITASKCIALLSFIIGTTLFTLQLYNDELDLIYMGLIFMSIAIIVNTISLFILIFSVLKSNKQKSELLITIGIVLLNIPIAILYFYILIETL